MRALSGPTLVKPNSGTSERAPQDIAHDLRHELSLLDGRIRALCSLWGHGFYHALGWELMQVEQDLQVLAALVEELPPPEAAAQGLEDASLEPTNVGDLALRIVGRFAPVAWRSRRLEVRVNVARGLPQILTDGSRLSQALSNLMINGIRHTPPGGLVLVRAFAHGKKVRIEVQDSGEGISPEDVDRIWERGYQGGDAGSRGSAGLGLAIVKDLVESFGGAVSASSEKERGSNFRIEIPVSG